MTTKQKDLIVWLLKISGAGLTSPFFIYIIGIISGSAQFKIQPSIANLIILLFGVKILHIAFDALGRY